MKTLLFAFLMLFVQEQTTITLYFLDTDKKPISGIFEINGQKHRTAGTLQITTTYGDYNFTFKSNCQTFKGKFKLFKHKQAIVVFMNNCPA
jgi:hypothetical protein